MFNLRFAKDYLLHSVNAKNRHGLHSPFVYRLVDTVFYDFEAKNVYTDVEKLRNGLLTDTRTITLTEPGTENYSSKKISVVAEETLRLPKIDQLLHRVAAFLKPANMLEISACPGITSLYLHAGAPKANLLAWEEKPETFDIAQDTFKKAKIDTINLLTGKYDTTFLRLINALDKLDFVLINSHHNSKGALKYFELCLPKAHEKTVFIFDGIYHNKEMAQAWNKIKANPKVTVTVDIFWIGLVFFRDGQAREDFKIKF